MEYNEMDPNIAVQRLAYHRKTALGLKDSKKALLATSVGSVLAVAGLQLPDTEPDSKAVHTISGALLPATLTLAAVSGLSGPLLRRRRDTQSKILAAAGIVPPQERDGAFTAPDGTRFLPPTEETKIWRIDISKRDLTAPKGRS